MSRLSDLIDQLKKENPRLGADLQAELSSHNQRTFGLVFERHLPESVELPGRPVRRGDNVHILPPRGSNDTPDTRLWRVNWLHKDNELGRVAQLIELYPKQDTEPELHDNVSVDDLVVVAQHNDTIYPSLVQTGEVIRSKDPNAPFHSVINAENYHALKMLTYTHYHSIDCIYIDPPYNTRAKDWKYNNDYVDKDDDYRHSKWLSFIERRLLIAKQLLKPNDSVLIVTIDEKEVHRLALLLEQTFPEARIQMVSSVINPKGVARDTFGRVDEYLFFVFIGSSRPMALELSDEWFVGEKRANLKPQWIPVRRSGTNSLRTDRPKLFYPIFAYNTDKGPKFHSVGDVLPLDKSRNTIIPPKNCVAIWPIRSDGSEGRYQQNPENLRHLIEQGYVKLGKWKGEKTTVSYLFKAEREKVETGQFKVLGRKHDGSLILNHEDYIPKQMAQSQWRIPSHDASTQGTGMTTKLLGEKRFTFPKSLYAVEDTIKFFVKDKPDATILDFFAGSGTTAHAVMRLNKQDGGHRRSISVTNNEVSADEQVKLRKQGLRPGDPEWEQWGICDYVTKPRVEAAITGRTPAGDPIKGNYKFTDEFPMSDGFEANARFFTLTYQPPTRVRHGLAFTDISPLLWLRAGQTGRIIESIPECGWDIAESYAIIENVAASAAFSKELNEHNNIKVIYIVTNDDLIFQSTAHELANHDAELVRLYSTYLNNFAFQQSRETI